MSTRYHPNQKAAVMVILDRNRGDIRATALQTGVPINTFATGSTTVTPICRRRTPPCTAVSRASRFCQRSGSPRFHSVKFKEGEQMWKYLRGK